MTPLIAEKHFAGRQCLGKRKMQEDAYAFSEVKVGDSGEKGLLLVVADGMGGHAAGNQASELAVRMFVAAFHRGGATLRARFTEALDVANGAIAEAIDADPDHREGMGTTLLGVVLTPAGLEWISIGDSPLYLWRRGELQRLNADHSFRPLLQDMIERHELTPEQAATSSLRNRLRAALIGGEMAMIDASSSPLALHHGDVILAGTDGVQTLNDESIAAALAKSGFVDAAAVATDLLRAVLESDKPKQDNATVAILQPPAEWILPPAFDPTGDDVATRRRPSAREGGPRIAPRHSAPP